MVDHTDTHKQSKVFDRCKACGIKWSITDLIPCKPNDRWLRMAIDVLEDKLAQAQAELEAVIKCKAALEIDR